MCKMDLVLGCSGKSVILNYLQTIPLDINFNTSN